MPSMDEIYKRHAAEYDELISAEDYEDNLGKWFEKNINWKNKTVYEAGIGTGRLLNYYISEIDRCFGFDREEHMLSRCMSNHSEYYQKLNLSIADNLEPPSHPDETDIFIEGWSFGHTLIQNIGQLLPTIRQLTESAISLVKNGGEIIIIETLGTNTEKPFFINNALMDFLHLLEKDYGFSKTCLRTDYRYPDCSEASRIMGFFFGDEMKADINKNHKNIIREYTGIWHLKI